MYKLYIRKALLRVFSRYLFTYYVEHVIHFINNKLLISNKMNVMTLGGFSGYALDLFDRSGRMKVIIYWWPTG